MLESKFLNHLCKIAGVGLAITSLILTAQFGASISVGMMFALAVISIMASYLPAIMVEVYESGRRWPLWFGIPVALLVTVVDVTTNASTTGVYRTTDVTQATVQQTRYEDKRDAVASAKEEVALFTKLIDDLKAQNPWATSVSADGLRGEIPALEEAIRQEANRGGCGPKCLALKQQMADLQNRIGIAERLDEHTKRLEAARRGLEKAIAQSETTQQGESSVATQNFRLASLVTLSRDPSDDARHWTDMLLMAFLGMVVTFSSQFFNALGFVGPRSGARLRERFAAPQKLAPVVPSLAEVHITPRTVPAPAPAVSERVVEHQPTIYHLKGADIMDMLRSSAQRAGFAAA